MKIIDPQKITVEMINALCALCPAAGDLKSNELRPALAAMMEAAPGVEPLTDSQIRDLIPIPQGGWTLIDFGMWVARAVERAHNIGRTADDGEC